MITTITLNPAIDQTMTLEKFVLGEVHRITEIQDQIGGKGINVSKVLQALNIETKATGMIGEDNRDVVCDLMTQAGIRPDFLSIKGKTRTNLKIVDTSTLLTTQLNAPGMSVKSSDLRALNGRVKEMAMRSDYVVMSGSLPPGLASDTYRKIIQEHAQCCAFVLDCAGDALVEGIKAHPFLIKPNLCELNAAFKKNLTTHTEIIAFCRVLLKTYDIGYILVSLGSSGSLLISDSLAYHASSLKVKAYSTVGAGDGLLAGFLAGLVRSLPLEDCLRMASVCGALMCARKNDAMFTHADVMANIEEIEINIL